MRGGMKGGLCLVRVRSGGRRGLLTRGLRRGLWVIGDFMPAKASISLLCFVELEREEFPERGGMLTRFRGVGRAVLPPSVQSWINLHRLRGL
jgi:hypothetical protein